MRRIEFTSAFRRDFRREKRSGRFPDLDSLLSGVITFLGENNPLPEKHRDHALVGEWTDFRECHLKPDLLLIYRKPK